MTSPSKNVILDQSEYHFGSVIMSQLKVGDIVTGEVISTKPFGAFVKLESGQTGLIHISQISDKYVEKVEDELEVGSTVKAKILSIDSVGKISLSIRALSTKNGRRNSGKKPSADFEDMMKKWLRSSEERLSALAAKQKKNR